MIKKRAVLKDSPVFIWSLLKTEKTNNYLTVTDVMCGLTPSYQ